MAIVFGELAMLYSAFSDGRPSPLDELPIQYGDYAGWQRERQREAAFGSDISFWKEQLHGCNTILRLPLTYPRPRSLTYRGKFQFMNIPGDLAESLRALSRKEGGTLFMTMFAAFNILLHSYTGRDDILVSVPLAKRNRTELEGLIGCFTNNLVMRTRLWGDPTFRELLNQVRSFCLGAYSHQDLPFERLLAELRPAEEQGYLPLVQVGFGLQISKAGDISVPSLQVHQIMINTDRAVLDLMARVEESSGRAIVSFQYKSDLFSEEGIRCMLGHYKTLLEVILRNPEERVSQLASAVKSQALQTVE